MANIAEYSSAFQMQATYKSYQRFSYEHTESKIIDGAQSKNTSSITAQWQRVEYLEISVQYYHAKSASEDVINYIDNCFDEFQQIQENIFDTFQEKLRNFYSMAKTALDEGFAEMKDHFSNNSSYLDSFYQQTVKELKDWYHNGGEPREKVNLASVSITAISKETTTLQAEISGKVKETISNLAERL